MGDLVSWGCLIAAVATAALLWFGRHRLGRGPLAGALFFAVTLSPMLGFIDYGFMKLSFVSERYAYLAGIGVLVVLVGGAAHIVVRLPALARIGASGMLVAVLAVLGKLTWDQGGVYRDDISFYNHIISLNPAAEPIHRNLALALDDRGDSVEALGAIRTAVERFPDSAAVHNTHGAILLGLNRLGDADQSFRRALELDPNHVNARQNMAETRRKQGRFVESLRWYGSVIEIDPEFAVAHAGMGAALFDLGQYGQAVESLEQAVSLQPDVLPDDVFRILGDAYRKERRYGEAMDTYRRILQTDSEYAPSHAGIGYAQLQLNRFDEAIESLTRAALLQPESPDAADRHVAMGRAFNALDRAEEAAEHYAAALEIDPRSATALDSFAVLRFRQQRYEEALRLYESLVGIGEANAQIHANMAATLSFLDRPGEALDSLDRALAMDPSLAETGLGEMREALRQRQR